MYLPQLISKQEQDSLLACKKQRNANGAVKQSQSARRYNRFPGTLGSTDWQPRGGWV